MTAIEYGDAQRARVRAQVASAARILSAAWPLRTFVAVNPLAGLQEHPFEHAVGLASDLLGLRGLPRPDQFRAWYAEGRITDADLDCALRRRLAGRDPMPAVHLGGRELDPLAVLRSDLLHGRDTSRQPLPRGAAEWSDRLLGTEIAPVVDEQVAKWCAAFCDTSQARLPMPGRERGLYGAWRALVGRDPALRRLGLSRERFAHMPEHPEDAILAALAVLRIPEREHRAELRAQLARLPGFTSHIKWRSEHPGQAPHPADLTELLAMRLAYESALVETAAVQRLAYGTAELRARVEECLQREPDADPGSANPARARGQAIERAAAVACALGAGALGAGAADADELEPLAELLELLPAEDRGWVWLSAYEWHYRDRLLAQLGRGAGPSSAARRAARPAAQAVFCIDARSEGIRRHLEARGEYRTFGFAGFYQLVIRYLSLHSSAAASLCPVVLTPTKTVTERPVAGGEVQAARSIAAELHADALNGAFHETKDGLASPFALAEAAGWVAGPLAAAKTLAPHGYARLRAGLSRRAERRVTETVAHALSDADAEALAAQSERQAIRLHLRRPGLGDGECEALRVRALAGGEPRLAAALDLDPDAHARRVGAARALGFDDAERLAWAEFALRSFGLVDAFARVVLLAGHGSRTENNAFEAALDCGACGGQRGGPNARIACALLNRPDLRGGLAERGIEIPHDTVFVAAEHDTATDRVEILDRHLIPDSHREEVARLQADLDAAGAGLAAERARRLPGRDHPRRRSRDWAQVRPEWGLARHAAFIVGPGEIPSGHDLECRAFLHSYDWRADPDGSVLETILTAPGLVVHWINAQYYFSAVDPDVLGAGDKTLHNVLGDIGVLQGHGGDLMLGLPWQSLGSDGRLYHEPMRVLFVVEAPVERVQSLIERNDLLRRYVDGGWVDLVVRDAPGEPWRRRADGSWEVWHPAATSENMEAIR